MKFALIDPSGAVSSTISNGCQRQVNAIAKCRRGRFTLGDGAPNAPIIITGPKTPVSKASPRKNMTAENKEPRTLYVVSVIYFFQVKILPFWPTGLAS